MASRFAPVRQLRGVSQVQPISTVRSAHLLNIGRTTLFELVREKRLRSVQIGRLRRFRLTDLEQFAAQLDNAREIFDAA